VARALGSDHDDVDVLGSLDGLEVYGEAVGKEEALSGTAIMITSAAATASPVSMTSKPSFLATSRDLDLG
jgi:hypothetical protein